MLHLALLHLVLNAAGSLTPSRRSAPGPEDESIAEALGAVGWMGWLRGCVPVAVLLGMLLALPSARATPMQIDFTFMLDQALGTLAAGTQLSAQIVYEGEGTMTTQYPDGVTHVWMIQSATIGGFTSTVKSGSFQIYDDSSVYHDMVGFKMSGFTLGGLDKLTFKMLLFAPNRAMVTGESMASLSTLNLAATTQRDVDFLRDNKRVSESTLAVDSWSVHAVSTATVPEGGATAAWCGLPALAMAWAARRRRGASAGH